MKIVSIIIFCIVLLGLSCKKDSQSETCPQQQIFYLSDFTKKFNFKKGSKWVFKNTSTNVIDTTWATTSNPGLYFGESYGTSKQCNIGDKHEFFQVDFWNNSFFNSASALYFKGTDKGFVGQYNAVGSVPLAVFNGNFGDSIFAEKNINYYSKIENIFPIIAINGNTYSNVYQMFYSPDLFGFKRIWWCPTIGFVKFEHYNTVTSQTEFWELESYAVQLY